MGTRSYPAKALTASLALALGVGCMTAPARADRITHATAVFSGLDKITGRIINFDVAIDETVQFGSLQITPRVCYTRPQTETPQTDGFVEVDEVGSDNQFKRIFSGWMFAASPGLHGVEHPVYDVWLTDCKGPGQVIASAPELPGQDDAAAAATGTPTARAAAPAAGKGRVTTPSGAAALPKPPNAPTQNSAGGPVEVGPPPGARAGVPVPPGNIPNVPPNANAPRRKPTQQFFPTTAEPSPQSGF